MREVVSTGAVAPEIMVVFERQVSKASNGNPAVWEITGTEPPFGDHVRLAYARPSPDGWIKVSRAEGDRYFGAFRIGVSHISRGRTDWMAK